MLLACFSHAAAFYVLLPDLVPSHFNAAGRPDAWSAKDSFIGVYLAATALCGVIFGGMGAVTARLPVSLINLPNKNYWLSDERKSETLSFLNAFMLLFGSATLGLLLFTFHQAFRVGLGRIATLEYMPVFLGLYVTISVGLTGWMLLKFGRRSS